jgi:hypothetical protein
MIDTSRSCPVRYRDESASSTASRSGLRSCQPGAVLRRLRPAHLVWAPTILFLDFDAWQLLINTATTIVTFLLVALLQNSQTRNNQATQHKLNAIADGLADLMEYVGGENQALQREVHELKLAVGWSTTKPPPTTPSPQIHRGIRLRLARRRVEPDSRRRRRRPPTRNGGQAWRR